MIVQKNTSGAKLLAPKGSDRLRLVGPVLRILLVSILLVLTVRVSSPQNETIWSAYETPGDLIRVILERSPVSGLRSTCSCCLKTPRRTARGSISD